MLTIAVLLATCVVVPSGPGAAVAPPASPTEPSRFECRWTELPIRIDGQPDDAAWKAAQVIERFSIPGAGKPASTATRARLLWDRENLYFLAEIEDADLYAEVREHDGQTWHDDVFELFVKPAEDKPGYYEFQVNPLGTMLDMFLPQRGNGGYERYRSEDEFHVRPLHDTYGISDARLVAPGSPERSVLLHRMSHRDRGHMPPLATSIVDRDAINLMQEWIAGMKVRTKQGE